MARIHRRNSIALALPTYAIPGIHDFAEDGETVQIDYPARVVRNLTRGGEIAITPLPDSVADIYRVGGVLELIRKRLADQGIVPEPDAAPA